MKHFIVYDPGTGAVLRAGVCQPEDLEKQAGPGEAVMEATRDAVMVAEVNLDPVREALHARIDAEAEAFRSRFITAGSGQAITYIRKQQEAAAFLADPEAPVPVLAAEAAAIGVSVAVLAGEVMAAAALWIAGMSLIEAARRGAKKAVDDAENIAAMHAAATIDWQALAAAIEEATA